MYNYKSPIETIVSEMYTRILQEQENKVFEAIQNMGINVDRDELMRALRYDRGQYDEGYSEGYVEGWIEANKKLVHCKECKHIDTDGCGAIYCEKWDRWEMPEDFFCSYGERKDNG